MDIFSKQRMIVWAIIVLVILNLGTLATLWINHFQRIAPPPRSGFGPPKQARTFLTRELAFTEDQKEQLKTLQTRQMAQMDALQHDIDDLKRRMMDELLTSSAETGTIDDLAGEIGEIEAKKSRLVYTHLEEIRDLCTPQQRKRYNGIIQEILQIMKPPAHQGLPGETGPGKDQPPVNNGRPPRPAGDRKDRLDTDRDGKVSRDEWIDHHRAIFSQEIDLDGNGYVSKAEWQTHHEKRPGSR